MSGYWCRVRASYAPYCVSRIYQSICNDACRDSASIRDEVQSRRSIGISLFFVVPQTQVQSTQPLTPHGVSCFSMLGNSPGINDIQSTSNQPRSSVSRNLSDSWCTWRRHIIHASTNFAGCLASGTFLGRPTVPMLGHLIPLATCLANPRLSCVAICFRRRRWDAGSAVKQALGIAQSYMWWCQPRRDPRSVSTWAFGQAVRSGGQTPSRLSYGQRRGVNK